MSIETYTETLIDRLHIRDESTKQSLREYSAFVKGVAADNYSTPRLMLLWQELSFWVRKARSLLDGKKSDKVSEQLVIILEVYQNIGSMIAIELDEAPNDIGRQMINDMQAMIRESQVSIQEAGYRLAGTARMDLGSDFKSRLTF